MDKLKLETPDMTEKNIEAIAKLFPNVITEGIDDSGEIKKLIDFDKLKQEFSDHVIEGDESYDFTWVGKRESMLEANKPIRKTLRPDRDSSLEWENTQNIYIEGDNLEALKLLQESYLGKVKMIYIDPPYNTGHDFVYKDNFTQSTDEYNEEIGLKDDEGNKLFQNTESNGRFHSDWCSMIYPRLKMARNLLSDEGVIFISIDDNEVDNLKKICDEIFGDENHISTLPRVTKRGGKSTDNIALNHDYLVIYSKNISNLRFNLQNHTDEGFKFKDEHSATRGLYKLNQTLDYDSLQYSPSLDYPLNIEGETFYPGGSIEKYNERKSGKYSRADWAWRWSQELFDFGYKNDFIVIKRYDNYSRIYTKTYQNVTIEKTNNGFEIKQIERTKPLSSLEFTENTFSNDNAKKHLGTLFETCPFDYSKPLSLMKFLIKFASNKGDTILDFFSGSATTAHAVMQLNAEDGGNRRFIMVQLPEPCDEKTEAYKLGYKNICEIGEERIRRAGIKIKNEIDSNNAQLKIGEEPKKVPDIGFRVFKVDDTNMNDVYYAPKDYNKTMLERMTSNIKSDRTDEDLLYGVLLDWGVELSLPHKVETIDGKKVHIVNDNELGADLIACFEENISETVVREIAKKQPTRVVFRDGSFNTDDHKINVEEIFKMIAPNTTVKVI